MYLPDAVFEVGNEAKGFAAFYFALLDGRTAQEIIELNGFNGGDASLVRRRF